MLIKFGDEAWRTDWWDGYTDDVEGALMDYVLLESWATEIRAFDVMSVHGLLQTPDYVRDLLRTENPGASEQQIERWSELRLKRQTILVRAAPPPLSIVVDEAALRRTVGGPNVFAAQLRQLVEYANQAEVELRVLPFNEGAHACPNGPFSIFTLTDPIPEVVFVESPAGALYLEPPKTERFAEMYDRLQKSAVTPDKSITFIESIARTLE